MSATAASVVTLRRCAADGCVSTSDLRTPSPVVLSYLSTLHSILPLPTKACAAHILKWERQMKKATQPQQQPPLQQCTLCHNIMLSQRQYAVTINGRKVSCCGSCSLKENRKRKVAEDEAMQVAIAVAAAADAAEVADRRIESLRSSGECTIIAAAQASPASFAAASNSICELISMSLLWLALSQALQCSQ